MKKKFINKYSLGSFFNKLNILFYSYLDNSNLLKITKNKSTNDKNTKENTDYQIFKL